MKKNTLVKQKSKLLQIFQKFSSSQLTSLRKYLHSPYFHQTDGVKALFQYLRKYHPEYPSQKVEDAVIARQLFPKSKNGIKKVQNFKSDLMQHVEQFLILEQMKQEASQQKFFLAKSYQALKLPQQAAKAIAKAKQISMTSPQLGLSRLQQELKIAHYDYFHPDTHKLFRNQEKLQYLLKQLDQYYVLAKFKYAFEVHERNKNQTEKLDVRLWEAVQNLVETNDLFKDQLPLLLYQQLNDLVNDSTFNEGAFKGLEQHFIQSLHLLEKEDQQAIFTYLINYTVRAMDAGLLHFANTQFELYKKGLSNHLIIRKSRITIASFLNIVSIAATCQAFDWLDQFMETYQNYLHPDFKATVLAISQAQIYFHQQQPEKALSILQPISFKNPDLELGTKPLEIKILFEIFLKDETYYDPIVSRLHSLTQNCAKKYSFAKEKMGAYRSYISFVQQLVKIASTPVDRKKALAAIEQAIHSSEHLIHKAWLLNVCKRMKT